MKARRVILVDAGTGNLHSVQNALQKLGVKVTVTDDPVVLARSREKVILPGVGAFGRFMEGLEQRKLLDVIPEVVQRGDPLLGICVGMQAFFEASEEMSESAGLGLLPGRVVRFPERQSLKVPHTGWNQIWPYQPSAFLEGLAPGAYAYFNHSYYCAAAEGADVLATTAYGQDFPCIVRRKNVYGVQFHPEKSQAIGLRLLENFVCMD
jgi:glutamine amidotransferase